MTRRPSVLGYRLFAAVALLLMKQAILGGIMPKSDLVEHEKVDLTLDRRKHPALEDSSWPIFAPRHHRPS